MTARTTAPMTRATRCRVRYECVTTVGSADLAGAVDVPADAPHLAQNWSESSVVLPHRTQNGMPRSSHSRQHSPNTTIGMRGKVLKRSAGVATRPHAHASKRDIVPPRPPVAARATIERGGRSRHLYLNTTDNLATSAPSDHVCPDPPPGSGNIVQRTLSAACAHGAGVGGGVLASRAKVWQRGQGSPHRGDERAARSAASGPSRGRGREGGAFHSLLSPIPPPL